MVFPGISRDFKSSLVAVESERVDATGIIPEINGRYGMKRWMSMQGSASGHRAESMRASLAATANVVKGWPPGSADLNSIKNLWPIVERCADEEKPATRGNLMG
jgi:hypothetical protein